MFLSTILKFAQLFLSCLPASTHFPRQNGRLKRLPHDWRPFVYFISPKSAHTLRTLPFNISWLYLRRLFLWFWPGWENTTILTIDVRSVFHECYLVGCRLTLEICLNGQLFTPHVTHTID